MYCDDDMLPLSGIQHFAFCQRQWALIHIEQSWEENVHTVLGDFFHARAHDEGLREKRGDILIVRGLGVASRELGLSGKCDVVEFRQCEDGFPLQSEEGLWRAAPVEYKKGKRKQRKADELQLCAQAICLEEMFCVDIPIGYLYYGQMHARSEVSLTADLRMQVRRSAEEMHRLFLKRHTPSVKKGARCEQCSLRNICLPEIDHKERVAAYYSRRLKERT